MARTGKMGLIYSEIAENEMKRDDHKIAQSKKQVMQRCPICNVVNDIITNVHCVKEHGMTKKEVESKYGKIVYERERMQMKIRQKELQNNVK